MSQLCEGLEASLQFRDDIVEDMSLKNNEQSFLKCQSKFSEKATYANWWWDRKQFLFNNNTCQYIKNQLLNEIEYP